MDFLWDFIDAAARKSAWGTEPFCVNEATHLWLSSRRGGHDQCVHIVSIAVLTASICAPRVMIEGDFSPK